MPDQLEDLRSQARDLADQRAAVTARAVDLAQRADASRAAASNAALAGDEAATTAAVTQAAQLSEERRATLHELTHLDGEWTAAVADLQGDPCDLESDVPLALLPVRLETRYSAGGATLSVRIFPDDIHVDRLDRGVSDDERAAGIAYWQAIWDGSKPADTAWRTLLAAVPGARAGWVAAALAPDLTTRPPVPGPLDVPVVANPPARRQLPPVARGLPDRFVVVAVQDGQRSTATGAAVPPTLVVGLSPTADPGQLVQHGAVTLGPGMEWLVDPDAAAAVGMLVDVPLARPGEPVQQVFAVGVRAGADPQDAAAELAALFEAHRWADGAEVVAAGTPTNNTDTDRAAWSARAAPVPPPTTPPVLSPDVAAVTTALGLDATSDTGLGSWPAPAVAAQPLAAAGNTALWQPTWGTFVERLVAGSMPQPTVGDDVRESWRDWWQGSVRGGGPLPVLRLGDQPYGLLPATAMTRVWNLDGAEPVETPLLTVLRNSRPLVAGGLSTVPVVGAGALDDTLLQALGTAPQLLGLRVRSLGSDGLLDALQLIFGLDGGGTDRAAQGQLVETLFLQLGLGAAIGFRGVVGATTRPLGLPLVADDDTAAMGDRTYVEAMLADAPRTVGSVLQALLEIAHGHEQRDVEQATPAELIGNVVDRGARLLADRGGEYREVVAQAQQGRIEPERLHAAADDLARRVGPSGPALLAALQPVPAARTSLANVALTLPLPDSGAAELAVSALGAWLRATARLAEFTRAAQSLVEAPLEQRGYAVAATLDCASHRYDAWVTSLATHRLAALRASTPTGVLLGAYGWVENLTPGGVTTRPGGYVHAPSPAQAATAGVLRSGYLTHNRDAAGSAALAVDLSSARVRVASALLDGVRQGQPLGALVGYLIERRLHEQRLDVYTLSLRALAPAAAGHVVDADALPADAQEAVGSSGVVDGVRLLALPRADIWAKLAAPPADNPYLDLARWPALGDHQAALEAVLDEAAQAYDAVSDVLLVESVHQLVQGNTPRAAATMSAAAGGDVAPVEPDVVRTPTRAVAVTHRVLLLLDDTPPGSGGWSTGTPRALAEPRLAAWAENRLGPATSIVMHVAADGTRTTLDAAGLSALDVVLDSAGATVVDGADGAALAAPALDSRLRATVPGLGTDPLPVAPDQEWGTGARAVGEVAVVAAALARLLTGARTVEPASFARPNDTPLRTVDAGGLAARLAPVVGGLQDATTALAAASTADPVDPAAVAAAVDGLRSYGIALAAGGASIAAAVLAEAERRVASALAVTVTDAASAQALGEAVFGAGFVVLAPVAAAADLFATAWGVLDPGRSAVRRWLLDLAAVRPGLANYTRTLLLSGAPSPGTGRALRIAQLAASGTAGTDTWLGAPLPAATPDQPVTDIVADAPAGWTGADAVAGLVVDEWVEQLPRRDADGTASVTTGLAVNANAPGARAPQAVLLAVLPDGSRWSTDGLIDVLAETRELAGLRAVTLDRLATPSPIMPAIQDQSWSLQGEPTIDLRTLVTALAEPRHVLPFVKDPD